MIRQIAIALAAGCASALMFVSVVSGAMLSLVLFYLAPLPLLVAALGWGSASALVAGIIATAGIGLMLGLPYMMAFAVTVALPGWWLGHLALLARPASEPQAGTEPVLQWYPAGRLVLWIAVFASLTAVAALLALGTDATTINDTLKRGLMRVFAGSVDASDTDAVVGVLVAIAPAAVTMVTLVALSLNLWLAGKIAQTSGRLPRPWPALNQIELPQLALGALAVALLLCLTSGLFALFAQIVSTALVVAYAVVGFAVLHMLTQAASMRGLWLASSYAVVVVFGWPLIVIALLGIADALFGFRRRRQARLRPPPVSS